MAQTHVKLWLDVSNFEHTLPKKALDNELIACNKLTSGYFVNPSCSLCISIAGHTPQSQKIHS